RVQRDVVRCQGQGPLEAVRPARQRLAGNVVEKVDVDRGNPGGARSQDGIGHVGPAVSTTECPQFLVLKTLRAQREARHAGIGKARGIASVVRPGVRLERYLSLRRKTEAFA